MKCPRKKENAAIITILLFFVSVIFFLSIWSISHRTYLKQPKIRLLPESHYAFNVWQENGIKGRILLLFDRHFNLLPQDITVLSNENYIYLAVMNNMIRKIYHIIPDRAWDEVNQSFVGYPSIRPVKSFFRTTIDDGTPLLIMRQGDIPRIKERVIIHITGDYWSESDISTIAAYIRNNIFRPDVITISGNISRRSLKELEVYETAR